MKVRIRKPHENEFYLVQHLFEELCTEAHVRDETHITGREVKEAFRVYLTKMQQYRNKLYVAEVNGNIQGYFFAIINPNNLFFRNKEIGEIAQVYICNEYRRKGIMRKGFKKLFRWFRNHNVAHVQISAFVHNSEALKAYRQLGFQEKKILLHREI